jgi:hypothetical protein
MNLSDFVVSQLALFSYRESERLCPGSYDAKLAIAWIIANRVRAGWNAGDYLQVLESAPLHSCSEPQDMLTFKMPEPWNQDWLKLTRDCQDIYEGIAKDEITWTPSASALAENLPGTDQYSINQSRPSFFYANLNMPIREWFMTKIIRKPEDHPRTVNISGGLVLFG